MSKYVVFAITLILLMVLPALASPYNSRLLNVSTQPVRNGHPMVRTPPGPQTEALRKGVICPFPAAQCSLSINWAGYADTNETNSVTFVNASWKVPKVAGVGEKKCTDPDFTWLDAAFWVGIDGFNNQYVEQTGTSSDCIYGQVAYYPWYEFYPALPGPMPSTDVIYPGDTMYAYVNYTTTFGIWIQDKTKGHMWSFSIKQDNPGAPRDSAEWITEAAFGCITADCSLGNFLALSNFGSVTFAGATATVVCSACVIPGTYTFPVASPAWGASNNWMAVTNVFYPPPGPFLRGYPSAAKNGAFKVTFVSSGP